LFVELFNADVYGNIRRCQGFVRRCTKEINQSGHELASVRIAAAIASMRRYNRFRVPYFQALLDQARKRIRATYDLYEYIAEKRDALERRAKYLQQVWDRPRLSVTEERPFSTLKLMSNQLLTLLL